MTMNEKYLNMRNCDHEWEILFMKYDKYDDHEWEILLWNMINMRNCDYEWKILFMKYEKYEKLWPWMRNT